MKPVAKKMANYRPEKRDLVAMQKSIEEWKQKVSLTRHPPLTPLAENLANLTNNKAQTEESSAEMHANVLVTFRSSPPSLSFVRNPYLLLSPRPVRAIFISQAWPLG